MAIHDWAHECVHDWTRLFNVTEREGEREKGEGRGNRWKNNKMGY